MGKRFRKLIVIVVGVVAALGLMLVGLFYLLGGLGLDLCGDDLLDQALSPDERYVAAVLQRDCGATGFGERHVNLRKSKPGFDHIDTSHTIDDGCVFGTDRYGAIDLIWKDARHLVIRATLADPAAERSSWKDVRISYEAVPIVIRHRKTAAVLLTVPRLWGADLRGAKLAGADLSRQDLRQANLQGADLRSANIERAFLGKANLRGTNLSGADLQFAILNEADLQGACLRGTNLEGAYLQHARLLHTDLRHADLQEDTNLEGADLTGANLTGATYSPCRQLETVWLGTIWPNGFDPRQHGAVLVGK